VITITGNDFNPSDTGSVNRVLRITNDVENQDCRISKRFLKLTCYIFIDKRVSSVLTDKNSKTDDSLPISAKTKVKFEIYGEEMIEKEVKLSGNSGRVYLPPDWVGHQVKIIRID